VKPNKWIPVEGVPGTSKTVMVTIVHQWLDRNGTPNRLYREGALDHPADYESVAYEPVGPNDWPTEGLGTFAPEERGMDSVTCFED
jgi:hypothetical protein